MASKAKRAESRARYFVRKIAGEKGWDTRHPDRGGNILEEQECDYFHNLGLGQLRPDFLFCVGGHPIMVVETKNNICKVDEAITQAEGYCNKINAKGNYNIKLAVGVAGETDFGYSVVVKFFCNGKWEDLKAKGYALTSIPSVKECMDSIAANDGTTELSIPSFSEFVDAAIETSNILHDAKIEPTLRPKVVGAITTAMYYGDIDIMSKTPLKDINFLMSEAIKNSSHFDEGKKKKLVESLTLGVNDFERLSSYLYRIVTILKRLNVKSVLQSDADFLGMFYEAFLRYGAENNAMGIVFTPRHITKLCTDLVGVEIGQNVIDITCGTGGFLVSAFDKLKTKAITENAQELIRESIYGFDTNPTVWALSCLNMFFRGDGKSHIENASSLAEESKAEVCNKFHRAFLNPPFHQEKEPERDFINASMDALVQGGLFVGVIYAGVFADQENSAWRADFMKKHTILAMISLPDDLFYPNASAITTIMVAKAHIPQPRDSKVLMGRIDNDGYTKLKGKRIECAGNQIPDVTEDFVRFLQNLPLRSKQCVLINNNLLRNGAEFSPQAFLPSRPLSDFEVRSQYSKTLMSLFQAITSFPEITDSLDDNKTTHPDLPKYPLSKTDKLSVFFEVRTGKSLGLKTYSEGITPYVSSGDGTNGVVGLINKNDGEICDGCISVSAFGTAYYQPWKYMARGNGGSSVRILIPKYTMNTRDIFWFIAQINSQKWRFTYARQAIKTRLQELEVTSPDEYQDDDIDIVNKINAFKQRLSELSKL